MVSFSLQTPGWGKIVLCDYDLNINWISKCFFFISLFLRIGCTVYSPPIPLHYNKIQNWINNNNDIKVQSTEAEYVRMWNTFKSQKTSNWIDIRNGELWNKIFIQYEILLLPSKSAISTIELTNFRSIEWCELFFFHFSLFRSIRMLCLWF